MKLLPRVHRSQTSQAEYIRAPSQGIPTNDLNQVFDTPSKIDYTNSPALTILFKRVY